MSTKIDRSFLRTVRPRVDQALEALGKELGVEFNLGNASFDDKTATFKLNIAVIGEDGEVVDVEAETFKQRATLYGLSPDDLGKTFNTNNGTFKITGLKPSRRKYPISADRVDDGKGFKFTAENVKRCLKT